MHVVDVVDQGATGVAGAVHVVDDVGPADVLLPAADHLHQLERGELGRLDHHGGACHESRDRVAGRQDQREVPGADDPHHGIGAVAHTELLDLGGDEPGAGRLVGEVLLGVLAPEVDRDLEVDGLEAGVAADLARLLLDDVRDVLAVLEHPVAPALEPAAALGEAHRLPLGLVRAHACDDLGHALGRVDRNALDDRAVGRAVHIEGFGARGVPVRARLGRPLARWSRRLAPWPELYRSSGIAAPVAGVG